MCLSAIGVDSLGCELKEALSVIKVDDITNSQLHGREVCCVLAAAPEGKRDNADMGGGL